MAVIVKSPQELLNALNKITTEKIEHAVTTAQREIAVYAFTQWTSAKFTWSKWQPNDVWSGQSRESISVSIGEPSTQYAPFVTGSWPIHESPYDQRDPFEARFKLEKIPAWTPVYVSNNAPHSENVELHTQGMRIAFEFTRSYFQSYSWKGVLKTSENVPF